jgi:hypothetical protein
MKLGSPAKTSRVEAGVDLAFADAAAACAAGGRAVLALARRSVVEDAALAEWEAAVGRRDAGLIGVPSRSPAIASPGVPWLNLNP